MAARTIKFEGKNYQFPDDATEQEISEALAGVHDQGPPANVTADPRMENPLSNARISPPESGAGGFFNRKLASVKTALGGNKPERGSGSGAVDLVGGPAIGPLHVAHGVTQMPRHPVQGFNEAVGGVAQTASLPLAVAAPATIPMSLPYVAGAKAGAWGLSEAGMDPDNAEALSNLVTMGVAGRGSLVRGTGKVLEKIGGTSDIPELPFPSKTGAAARMFNAVKRPIGQAGRRMANYGVPQAPNVFDGDMNGPLPGEPDLPTPVKPDGAVYHNDVTDRGELDKLLDQVSQQPEVRQGRDPVQADDIEHHNDVNPKYAAVDGTTTKLAISPKVSNPTKARMFHGTTADNVSSILKSGLLANEDGRGPYLTPDKSIAEFASRAQASQQGGSDAPWQTAHDPENFGVQRAILDVDVDRGNLSQDEGMEDGSAYETPKGLPPNAIRGISYDPPLQLKESPFTRRVPTADDTPTPNSDTLLRAIKSAPGWPENGLPNEPWDKLNGPDLDSDPYNRIDEIEASRPKRRASDNPDKLLDDLSRGGKESALTDKLSGLPSQWSKLGVDPDSFLRPARPGFLEDAQDWMNTFGKGADRSNFSSWVEQGKPGVRPFSRSTDTVGSAQGAADDTNDFQQAKNSLGPDASVSEIAMEAQRLKLKRTGGK